MALQTGRGQPVPASASRDWVLPNFMRSEESMMCSQTFRIGGFIWHLACLPTSSDILLQDHVGLLLWYYRANKIAPESPQWPDTAFTLTIKNHTDASKSLAMDAVHKFSSEEKNRGFDGMISRQRLASEGFLAEDGSLTIRLDLTVFNPRETCGLYRDSLDASGADFLSLLEDPGATSDLTVIVGGGDGSAAGGSTDGNAAGNSNSTSNGKQRRRGRGVGAGTRQGTRGDTDPALGSLHQRSFRVHRVVLAARCPFFRTLFNAGMADSAARELPLPDADPDAFAVLLRYMYGGEVPPCERAVHRAAVPLCDMLLLPKVKEALVEVLVANMDASTIVADLLWAAQAGQEEVLEELVGVYRRVAQDVDPGEVAALAAASPQLASRVIMGLSNPPAAAAAAAVATAAGPANKGGRKRART